MHVIHNKTARLVSIALNSREMLHIPPRADSRPLKRAEVDGNAKVKKLSDENLIKVEPPLQEEEVKRKASSKITAIGKSRPRHRNKK